MVYLVVAAITLVAGFVQGVAGFGFGMVSMGVLPFVLPVKTAVPLIAVFGLFVNGMLLWELRRHIDLSRAKGLLLMTFVGIPLGVAFLKGFDASVVKLVLGVVILLYTTTSLMGTLKPIPHIHTAWGWVMGLFGGVLGGAFGTGGPPVIIYMTLADWPKDLIKSTLPAIFLLTSVFQTILFAANGMLGAEQLELNAVALPGLVLGVWLGSRLYAIIDQALFKRIILILLTILGVVFIVNR